MQSSPSEHALPSSAASATSWHALSTQAAFWQGPGVSSASHSASVVHAQGVATQAPPSQRSSVVQATPSSQLPPTTGGYAQPSAASHASSVQGLPSAAQLTSLHALLLLARSQTLQAFAEDTAPAG